MADLKFIKSETELQVLQDGQLCNYMFMMYRKGEDGWYKNTILPPCELGVGPASLGLTSAAGVNVSFDVTADCDAKAVFVDLELAISMLEQRAKSYSLAPLDRVNAIFGVRELIKKESHFLKDGAKLNCTLSLFSEDEKVDFEGRAAMFTAVLRFFEKNEAAEITLCSEVCPVLSPIPFTSLYSHIDFTAKLTAGAMGYDGVLWLDCVYKKYILSKNGANVFIRFKDSLVTPPTEKCLNARLVSELAKSWGIDVTERKISIDELSQSKDDICEIFTAGDTEGISAVCEIEVQDGIINLAPGKLTRKICDSIKSLREGVMNLPAFKFERI